MRGGEIRTHNLRMSGASCWDAIQWCRVGYCVYKKMFISLVAMHLHAVHIVHVHPQQSRRFLWWFSLCQQLTMFSALWRAKRAERQVCGAKFEMRESSQCTNFRVTLVSTSKLNARCKPQRQWKVRMILIKKKEKKSNGSHNFTSTQNYKKDLESVSSFIQSQLECWKSDMNGTTGDDDDSFHVGIVEEKCLFNFKFHAFRWKYVAVLPFFLCLRGNIALPSTSWAQILIYISIYKLFGFGISRTWLRREWASLGRPMNYELPWSDCQLLCAILHHVAFSFFSFFARLVKPRKSLLLPPPTGSSLVSTFFHLSSYVLCSSHISFLDIDLARSRKYILCCVCGTIHSKMWYDQGLLILFSVFFLNMKEILVKFHIKLNFSFMPALLQLGWSFFCLLSSLQGLVRSSRVEKKFSNSLSEFIFILRRPSSLPS